MDPLEARPSTQGKHHGTSYIKAAVSHLLHQNVADLITDTDTHQSFSDCSEEEFTLAKHASVLYVI